MNFEDKIKSLRASIWSQLSPLVQGHPVALFGLPCHGNMGDTFISLGELAFLEECGVRILYKKMLIDSSPLPELPKDCVMLMQGGGDFGDVWRGIQEARLAVIHHYASHRIVVFPQTIYYNDMELCEQDAAALNRCTDLTICVRDSRARDFMLKHFQCNILLVPDMAFFIPVQSLRKYMVAPNRKALYLRRTDKEFKVDSPNVPADAVVSDWPTVGNRQIYLKLNLRLVGYTDAFRLRNMNFMSSVLRRTAVWEMLHVAYPIVARYGVRFLSSYQDLYLTRLHGAIVSVLLGKGFYLMDNSYHKNLYFFDTWLSDLDGVHLVQTDKVVGR